MSVVRFLFPDNPLSRLVTAPGGKARTEAVAAAADNLATLEVACGDELDRALGRIGEMTAGRRDPLSDAEFEAIYRDVCGLIGLAAASPPLADFAAGARSLCDLLDGLQTAGRWNAPAVGVHLDALHLLRRSQGADGAAALRALRAMTLKIAPAPTP